MTNTALDGVGERIAPLLQQVEFEARRLQRSVGGNADFDELRSWGAEGLLQAAKRFDPSRGVPFGAFARARITGAMVDGLRASSDIPRAILRARRHGGDADDEARAIERHQVGVATAIAHGLLHEAAAGEEGEWMPRSRDRGPEAALWEAQRSQLVRDAVERLPTTEGALVQRHLLDDVKLDDVARELGLSAARAGRLLERARLLLARQLRGASGWED